MGKMGFSKDIFSKTQKLGKFKCCTQPSHAEWPKNPTQYFQALPTPHPANPAVPTQNSHFNKKHFVGAFLKHTAAQLYC